MKPIRTHIDSIRPKYFLFDIIDSCIRERVALLVAAIPSLLGVKNAFEALAIIPIYSEGIEAAATGEDISPYIVAMINSRSTGWPPSSSS